MSLFLTAFICNFKDYYLTDELQIKTDKGIKKLSLSLRAQGYGEAV